MARVVKGRGLLVSSILSVMEVKPVWLVGMSFAVSGMKGLVDWRGTLEL